MVCPDCGSDEKNSESGEIFCKKCGLELDEMVIAKEGKGHYKVIKIPHINVRINPKTELYALKLGLKNNKLHNNWEKILGFKLNSGTLKPELKNKALLMIRDAYSKNGELLSNSAQRIRTNWLTINNKFFFEMETILNFEWPTNEFDCFLSLCSKFGFHNSSKNFIIIQQELNEISNYVIAHELFMIIFRNYINRFFKEKFDEKDSEISKIVVAFILLTQPKLKTCFPQMKFTIDMFHTDEYKVLVKKLWPIWKEQKPFKDFMINVYSTLNIEKTWVSY